jgi:uncharacterized small protein (DUF1192 family)
VLIKRNERIAALEEEVKRLREGMGPLGETL